MFRPTIALLVIVVTACSSASGAGSFTTVEAARNNIEDAMASVVAGDLNAAFTKFRNYWPMPAAEVSALLEKTIDQRRRLALRFGKPLGYELVDEDKVGDFLVRYVYVEKCERTAIRWTFVIYKSKANWAFNSVAWDDNVLALFDQ
jgi:hypothetical protein